MLPGRGGGMKQLAVYGKVAVTWFKQFGRITMESRVLETLISTQLVNGINVLQKYIIILLQNKLNCCCGNYQKIMHSSLLCSKINSMFLFLQIQPMLFLPKRPIARDMRPRAMALSSFLQHLSVISVPPTSEVE